MSYLAAIYRYVAKCSSRAAYNNLHSVIHTQWMIAIVYVGMVKYSYQAICMYAQFTAKWLNVSLHQSAQRMTTLPDG